jgi:LysM domain-containing protein
VTGERYVVKTGESLWTIARTKLGDGKHWPRIWRYNNRVDVIKVTGRGIPDPNVIQVGQVLLLPVLPKEATQVKDVTPESAIAPPPATARSAQPLRSPAPQPTPSGAPLPSIDGLTSPISLKYRLDDILLPPVVQPGVIIEMRMTGDVVLMSKKLYPAVYVTQRREIEAQVVTQANHAYGSLTNDTRLIYDPVANTMTYRAMLVSQSNVPGAMAVATGVQFDSNTPVPKLRFEFRFPKLEGTIEDFFYLALDIKVVVEVTPKPDVPGRSAQPLRSPQVATNWSRVIGTGLIVVGVVVVVGTLVEDFFTLGGGTVDDPASFAAAAAAFARGWQLIRGSSALLPLAAVPATLTMQLQVQSATGAGTKSAPAK